MNEVATTAGAVILNFGLVLSLLTYLVSSRKQADTKIQTLLDQVAQLFNELNKERSAHQTTRNQKSIVEAQIGEIQRNADDTARQNKTLSELVDRTYDKVNRLENDIVTQGKTLGSEINAWQTKSQEHERRIEGLETANADLIKVNLNLQAQKAELEETKASLLTTVNSHQKTIMRQDGEIADYQAANYTLKAKLDESEKVKSQLSKDNEALAAQIVELSKQIDELKVMVAQLSADVDTLSNKVDTQQMTVVNTSEIDTHAD